MRIMLLFAHPVETSFGAALHRTAIDTLLQGGHEVDDCDLYAENFQPVLNRQERLDYHDPSKNKIYIKPYVERLQVAEALVFCYPIWNYGPPAIMKGFFDRIFVPGVFFDILPNGKIVGKLTNIKKMTCILTYGGNRWRTILAGDPPRKFMCRAIPQGTDFRVRMKFLAQYDMNNMDEQKGERFLQKVRSRMLKF